MGPVGGCGAAFGADVTLGKGAALGVGVVAFAVDTTLGAGEDFGAVAALGAGATLGAGSAFAGRG